MKVHTAVSLIASFAARYPNPGGEKNVLPTIQAGSSGQLSSVEGAAAIRNAALPQGKQQYVRATNGHFLVAGELIKEGEIVQVAKNLATRLIHSGQAEAVTDEEVAQAQAEEKKAKK